VNNILFLGEMKSFILQESLLSPKEIEAVIKSLPTKNKSQDQMGLVQDSIRPSKNT
jgi:hypothetical protein